MCVQPCGSDPNFIGKIPNHCSATICPPVGLDICAGSSNRKDTIGTLYGVQDCARRHSDLKLVSLFRKSG